MEIADASQRTLLTELQSQGLRLADDTTGAPGRRGGAGPSDHKAVTIDGLTIMVPVHSADALSSPYEVGRPHPDGTATLKRNRVPIKAIAFPRTPRFYQLQTFDGIPYWKIATLHGANVLATTVLQTCVRYGRRSTSCQFCAIGESLKGGRTNNRKTPEQLGEVARAAMLLDGIQHMVMTTGTPNFTDRGAEILCDSAFGVKAATVNHAGIANGLPIQGQCEPPDDPRWYARMKQAGIDALGLHIEAVTQSVREQIMPGKATVTVDHYLAAFEQAVAVFGRGQVSTYILYGLGDTREAVLAMSETLIALGVYPFVVPFAPIAGTPLENRRSPSAAEMRDVLTPLGRMLHAGGLKSADIKAGCGKCGACSSLSAYESR